MPGEKRKLDEDTWISTQSKKFKCGQLLANVYAYTLAQLRLGSRKFYGASPRGEGGVSPFNSPPGSPLVRDVIGGEEEEGKERQRPHNVCGPCSRKFKENEEGWGRCYYCEATVCHLNICGRCKEGYCGGCCITKYDGPYEGIFECYSCLQ